MLECIDREKGVYHDPEYSLFLFSKEKFEDFAKK